MNKLKLNDNFPKPSDCCDDTCGSTEYSEVSNSQFSNCSGGNTMGSHRSVVDNSGIVQYYDLPIRPDFAQTKWINNAPDCTGKPDECAKRGYKGWTGRSSDVGGGPFNPSWSQCPIKSGCSGCWDPLGVNAHTGHQLCSVSSEMQIDRCPFYNVLSDPSVISDSTSSYVNIQCGNCADVSCSFDQLYYNNGPLVWNDTTPLGYCRYPVDSIKNPGDVEKLIVSGGDGNEINLANNLIGKYCFQTVKTCKDANPGIPVNSCPRIISTASDDAPCRQWAQNNPGWADPLKVQWCSANNSSLACDCISRATDPSGNAARTFYSAAIGAHPYAARCWYRPCSSQNGYALNTEEIFSQKCPDNVTVCDAVINAIDDNKVTIDDNKVWGTCNISSTPGTTPGTKPVNPSSGGTPTDWFAENKKDFIIAGSVFGGVVLLIIIVIVSLYFYRKKHPL